MPFSGLSNLVDVTRATAALERAWTEIEPTLDPSQDKARERERLSYIVAAQALVTDDVDELAKRAAARFNATRL